MAFALGGAEQRALYETMCATRALDRRIAALAARGRAGPWVGAGGHEAIAAGAAAALRATDWIFPGFRDHAALLWRGRGLGPLVAQALGARSAPGGGRGLPMHHAWREGRVAPVPVTPGAHLAHATGAAAAARLRGGDEVALALCGAGAVRRGELHAALELAAALKAPVVFVATTTGAAADAPAGTDAEAVDGDDLEAIVAAVGRAVERARAGNGAAAIAARCDDAADPVERWRALLAGRGQWDDAQERALGARLDAELDAAVARADEAGPPAAASLVEDVRARRAKTAAA